MTRKFFTSLLFVGFLVAPIASAVEVPASAPVQTLPSAAAKRSLKPFAGRWDGTVNLETANGGFQTYDNLRIRILKPKAGAKTAKVKGTAVLEYYGPNGTVRKKVKIYGSISKPVSYNIYGTKVKLSLKTSDKTKVNGSLTYFSYMGNTAAVGKAVFRRGKWSGEGVFTKFGVN